MDFDGSEIGKTQQKNQPERNKKMEQKTEEESFKMVQELIRKTREERKKMLQKTQELRTRMMEKVAVYKLVRSTSDTDMNCSDRFEDHEKSIGERKELELKIQQMMMRKYEKSIEERRQKEQIIL